MDEYRFEVIDSETLWMERYNQLPEEYRDIYFRFQYIDLYTAENEKPIAVFYENSRGGIIFYSFILSEVKSGGLFKGQWYDISSAYGYGGPIVYNCSEKDRMLFEDLFLHWCNKNCIIAEFVRFHPLYDNHKFFSKDIEVIKNRDTVAIDLSLGREVIWNKEFKGAMRTKIRKAIKSGVDIHISEDLEAFTGIYRKTMGRLDADGYYFFSDRYFESIEKFGSESFFVIYAKYEDEVIAGALFFVSGGNLHYHLGGSIKAYQNLRPNNYILYRAMEYGIDTGCTTFHLGGGRTSADDDSLLRYKQEFSSIKKEFYIGKRIHQKKIYDLLISEWEKKHQQKSSLFLQYRE